MKKKYLAAMVFAAALPTIASAGSLDSLNNLNSGLQKIQGLTGGSEEGGLLGQLNLSPTQKDKLERLQVTSGRDQIAIYQKYMAKLPEADQKALKAELAATNDKNNTEMRSLLDAKQLKKLDSIKSDYDMLNFAK